MERPKRTAARVAEEASILGVSHGDMKEHMQAQRQLERRLAQERKRAEQTSAGEPEEVVVLDGYHPYPERFVADNVREVAYWYKEDEDKKNWFESRKNVSEEEEQARQRQREEEEEQARQERQRQKRQRQERQRQDPVREERYEAHQRPLRTAGAIARARAAGVGDLNAPEQQKLMRQFESEQTAKMKESEPDEEVDAMVAKWRRNQFKIKVPVPEEIRRQQQKERQQQMERQERVTNMFDERERRQDTATALSALSAVAAQERERQEGERQQDAATALSALFAAPAERPKERDLNEFSGIMTTEPTTAAPS